MDYDNYNENKNKNELIEDPTYEHEELNGIPLKAEEIDEEELDDLLHDEHENNNQIDIKHEDKNEDETINNEEEIIDDEDDNHNQQEMESQNDESNGNTMDIIDEMEASIKDIISEGQNIMNRLRRSTRDRNQVD